MSMSTEIIEMSRNPEVVPLVFNVDGYRVPNITGAKLKGSDLITLTLNRFGEPYCTMDVSEEEIKKWMWFTANAMAVSAGYSSHGSNSNKMNPHGASDVNRVISVLNRCVG